MFHKRNFLHHCMGARRNLRREGTQAPHAHGEKVVKNWQKGPHKEKNVVSGYHSFSLAVRSMSKFQMETVKVM